MARHQGEQDGNCVANGRVNKDGVNEVLVSKLRNAGLRPTKQRTALAELLFKKGNRHVSAEDLFEEAKLAKIEISLATVYNALNQFSSAGLLRTISIDSNRVYFDTKTGNHHHFFLEESSELVDMPEGYIRVENLPDVPQGTQISSIDVIVRVRKAF